LWGLKKQNVELKFVPISCSTEEWVSIHGGPITVAKLPAFVMSYQSESQNTDNNITTRTAFHCEILFCVAKKYFMHLQPVTWTLVFPIGGIGPVKFIGA
jgi:hypothetical protein